MDVCYMCQKENCERDCYFRVGKICKYNEFEGNGGEPQCDPNECICCGEDDEIVLVPETEWSKFLRIKGICSSNEYTGNHPCDNGVLCDRCHNKDIQDEFKNWKAEDKEKVYYGVKDNSTGECAKSESLDSILEFIKNAVLDGSPIERIVFTNK